MTEATSGRVSVLRGEAHRSQAQHPSAGPAPHHGRADGDRQTTAVTRGPQLTAQRSPGLPSAQDIARKIGEVPLSDTELGTTGPIYLWYYILKEAELRHNGGRLGAVGALIVTEVLLGLLDADSLSYRSTYPNWTPTLANSEGRFGIAELLRFAGVVK